uniref:Tudor domain-containing protein n=1 Tax=Rhabditophanes sp. KR3021 TaxID=114890 RepID=A0AC35TZB8_9BILA
MWSDSEKDFWCKTIAKNTGEDSYLCHLYSTILNIDENEEATSIPRRNHEQAYAKALDPGCSDNILEDTLKVQDLLIGQKILALYDEEMYAAKVISINSKDNKCTVEFEGFEEEGYFEVGDEEIEYYEESEEPMLGNCFCANQKVFAQFPNDECYYMGTILSVNENLLKVAFMGFETVNALDIDASKALLCSNECYEYIKSSGVSICFGSLPDLPTEPEDLLKCYQDAIDTQRQFGEYLTTIYEKKMVEGFTELLDGKAKTSIAYPLETYDDFVQVWCYSAFASEFYKLQISNH